MSNQECIVDFLRKFGLNENEIRIYHLIAFAGPLKATVIAKNLKMHKIQVYRCLENMEKKGAVQEAFEKPKRFAATPIENLLFEKIQDGASSLKYLVTQKKKISESWRALNKENIQQRIEKFAIIQGMEKLGAAVEGLRRRSQKELITLITLKALVRVNLAGRHDKIMQGKVPFKYRVLTQIPKKKCQIAV